MKRFKTSTKHQMIHNVRRVEGAINLGCFSNTEVVVSILRVQNNIEEANAGDEELLNDARTNAIRYN